MKAAEYVRYDALGLADLVRRKEVGPLELLEIATAQANRANPKVNAIVARLDDFGRRAIKDGLPNGTFSGVPFLLKDLGTSLGGVPTSNGCRFTSDHTRSYDSETTKRLKKTGLVIFGKTNTPEFGLLPVTEPKLFGPAKNPWDFSRNTGGSSGGAAGAVASGIIPMAHGGDGGGSLRIPASCCGLFGFKATEGRSPSGPDTGRHWFGLAVEGAVTRSVRDSAAFLDAISDPEIGAAIVTPRPKETFLSQIEKDPGQLKIGLVTKPFFRAQLDRDCLKATQDAAQLCADLGHHVEEAEIDLGIDVEILTKAFLIVIASETAHGVKYFSEINKRAPGIGDLEPTTHLMRRGGEYFSSAALAEAIFIFDLTRRAVAQSMAKYDVILTPTLAMPPPKIGALMPKGLPDQMMLHTLTRTSVGPLIKLAFNMMPAKAFAFTPYTGLFNITGQPAMSVPLYWNEANLPIGVQFVAQHGEDGLLFSLAGQLEKARPWLNRLPSWVLA